ncbi:E3 ubiquitin-protein ligase [Ceratobasidium theobromae]|uniref:E3 ubiquitin-protein ligase n=1 Tax=Ceratobasidium theobromae TaxID=1582974 RepID=A0A5N5QHN1_9AGAM|nr:E3 ubiquitin-protein ligase [Ceratobasidium theobromae]
MNAKLRVIHFNDGEARIFSIAQGVLKLLIVYRLTRPKLKEDKENKDKFVLDMKVIDPEGKIMDSYTHIIQFYEKIESIRSKWDPEKPNSGELESLLLFSGDLFNPSVESSVTYGGNMVHLMNEIMPDASVPGNHEFDVSLITLFRIVYRPFLSITSSSAANALTLWFNSPWVASNLRLKDPPGKKIKRLHPYIVIERPGLRIGVIGLVSADSWRKTNTKVQEGLKRSEMLDACKALVPQLRKPKDEKGEGCDLVFALTHALHTEDIELAKAVGAYPGELEKCRDIDFGVDILFGGHDHDYFLGKGVKRGFGSELRNDGIKPNDDDDGVLIIKSGYDFFDLSEVEVEVAEIYEAEHRKKVVKSVTVSRHHFKAPTAGEEPVPTGPSAITRMLKHQLNDEVIEALAEPVATLAADIHMNSKLTRREETALGNWIADSLLDWYCKHKSKQAGPKSLVPTVFVMNGGAIRGNGTLDRENHLLARHIIQLLPFDSSLKSFRMKRLHLKKALSAMLSTESDFPVVSGMKVEWIRNSKEVTRVLIDEPGPGPNSDDAKIDVLTNEYVAQHINYFGSLNDRQKENLTTFEELPTYQILQYYLNDRKKLKPWANEFVTTLRSLEERDGVGFKEDFWNGFVKRLLESEMDGYELPKVNIPAQVEKKRMHGPAPRRPFSVDPPGHIRLYGPTGAVCNDGNASQPIAGGPRPASAPAIAAPHRAQPTGGHSATARRAIATREHNPRQAILYSIILYLRSGGPTHRLRLVPHLDPSARTLHFEPIVRDVRAGGAVLRIGRFTDRVGANARQSDSTKIAFKSKAHIGCFPSDLQFMIRDTRSSSGTFLNHTRLAAPNIESRPSELHDGDIVQLGVDYQGGTEEIYRCVKIRVEIGREWQREANEFNTVALQQLQTLQGRGAEARDKGKEKPRTSAIAGPSNSRKTSVADCCICLFPVAILQSLFIAPCSHCFHYKCIRPLLVQHHPGFSCPLCRTFSDLEEDVEKEYAPSVYAPSVAPSVFDDNESHGVMNIVENAIASIKGPSVDVAVGTSPDPSPPHATKDLPPVPSQHHSDGGSTPRGSSEDLRAAQRGLFDATLVSQDPDEAAIMVPGGIIVPRSPDREHDILNSATPLNNQFLTLAALNGVLPSIPSSGDVSALRSQNSSSGDLKHDLDDLDEDPVLVDFKRLVLGEAGPSRSKTS